MYGNGAAIGTEFIFIKVKRQRTHRVHHPGREVSDVAAVGSTPHLVAAYHTGAATFVQAVTIIWDFAWLIVQVIDLNEFFKK